MPTLKRTRVVVALTIVLITVGLQTSQGPYSAAYPIPQATRVPVTSAPTHPLYETRAVHDPNGIGKFYMGREIAQMMGPGGIAWLDRPERENEERPGVVIDALHLWQGEVVVDLGAGSGYFTFRIARKVGRTGKVLAVETQDQMFETIRRRAKALRVTNVREVKGTEMDPRLPADSVDLVVMVDVYHELAYPF